MKIYKNSKIILEDGILENHILIADHKIRKICLDHEYTQKESDVVIDLKGHYLSPGFVNLHIHGSNGHDAMDGSKKAIDAISSILPHSGVTAYMPTTMTMSKDRIDKSLNSIQTVMNQEKQHGAEVLGVHLEGPFISEDFKGAQDPQFIETPTYDLYKPYYDIIKLITVAPEKDHDYNFAKKVKINYPNMVLSIGHSSASYEIALEAFHNGFSHITHLFNAMTGLHHRKPGIVGAALTEDFYTELIADNIHVRPELYKLILKAKGKDHLVLITDAMCAACLSPGEYELGGQAVIVDQTSARLHSGVLAGSILTMEKAISNFYTYTDLQLHEVVNLATKNPAQELGLYHRIGSIAENKDADLVVFDRSFNICQTYCKGQLVYSKEEIHAS